MSTKEHPKGCLCNTCVVIDTGVKRGMLSLTDDDQVGLTDSFRARVTQNAEEVIVLSSRPDGSGTDSDEDIIGRAVVLTIVECYNKERINKKELCQMTDWVMNILRIRDGTELIEKG
ncbi:MAG: hypothetical protein ACREA8_09795 [Nitrosotalea sp.]